MSAFGPKRTSLAALHMSAFGGKADIAIAVSCIWPGPDPRRALWPAACAARTRRTHGCTDQGCKREKSSCQPGAVHTWPLADMDGCNFWGAQAFLGYSTAAARRNCR